MSEQKKSKSRFVKSIAPISKDSLGMSNRGFAYIKRVEVLEDGTEEVTTDILPITTARADAVRKQFSKDRAPRPPVRTTLVSHESEEGKAYGLTKPTICDVPNYADEKYIREYEEFSERMAWAMVAEALDIPMTVLDGAGLQITAKTTDEKIAAMRAAGFTSAQVLQIMSDVGRISAFSEEERRSFFVMNSVSR